LGGVAFFVLDDLFGRAGGDNLTVGIASAFIGM
jgi:hypothetical protein